MKLRTLLGWIAYFVGAILAFAWIALMSHLTVLAAVTYAKWRGWVS